MEVEKNDDLNNFILNWNIDFPIDRWFRKTYSIPFNSSKHRESSFYDMFIEYTEDSLYEDSFKRSALLKSQEKYIPGKNNWLIVKEVDQSMSDETFDNIDIEDM